MAHVEYDIFVPIFDNEGRKYDEFILNEFKKKVTEKFGGLTDTRYRSEGTWRVGNVYHRDEIVIWRALAMDDDVKEFMAELKKEMAKALHQKEILIVQREVQVI